MDTDTQLEKIPLDTDDDLEELIKQVCDLKGDVGYKLASTFTFGTKLFLIFQKV